MAAAGSAPEQRLLARVARLVRRQFVALIVLAGGLTVTLLLGWQLARTVQTKDRERFVHAVERLQDAIEGRLATYTDMLRAGAGLLDVEGPFDRQSFHAFVRRLEPQTRYPGILGIGFTRRIAPAELSLVVGQQQRDFPDFKVWPEQPRDEYHAILYLEPLDTRNRVAIGYDMYTDETRRLAMGRARDTGTAAASGPVILVQEIDDHKQPGFLIYVPVYSGAGIPASVEERRARLRGFVYSPFRAGDLFAGILGDDTESRAGFELVDEAAPDFALHRTGERVSGGFTATRHLEVAGRRWQVSYFALPGLARSSHAGFVPIAGWIGVAISFIIAALVSLQTAARQRLELSQRETEAASRAAREHVEALEVINATGAQLAAELDLERLVQAVTDAGVRLTRARFGAFFYNVVSRSGESYTLHALSGIPREAFERFSMPRNTAVFGPTFRGERIVRSDDITADERYGHSAPYHGMPAGHPPVRSYLAVPVVSRSGEVIGGLFFGHPEPAMFSEQHERILGGVAAQAAIAIDNARLYNRVQDLLERERLARTEAERVNHLKDEFLATLSHELRTPLNAVIGWTHLLQRGGVPAGAVDQALATILRNALAQAELINDLLDMSRIISGRLHIATAEVRVSELLESALAVVRPAADAKGVALVTRFEADPAIIGDGARLQQVFWNLLSNAVKFTARGGRVEVALRTEDGYVEAQVRDDGIGIDPEFLPWIFDRFRQADGSLGREHGGLGLGLSIVQSLVQMHGGTIEARSEGLNRGATFIVRLPLSEAALPSATVA